MKTIFGSSILTLFFCILSLGTINAQTPEGREDKAIVKESEAVEFNHDYKHKFNKPQGRRGLKVKESKGPVGASSYKHQTGKKAETGDRVFVRTTSVPADRNYKHQVPLKRSSK